jgi:multidrug efflux system membrane fusion protein
MKKSSFHALILAAGTALLLVGEVACSGGSGTPVAPADPGAPVSVAVATTKNVPVEIHAIGQAQPYSTVSVKPQVTAQLMAIHFREGQDVNKGDLLFTLDKQPFETALAQAQATLAKDKAQALNSAAQQERYAKLLAAGIASKEQIDQFQAQADADRALVKADAAAVETARLQLQYCTITAPISGRTGALQVYPGNLVKANDVPVLVVINQVTPIYVDFSVPERYLAQVTKYLAAGRLPVQGYTPDDVAHPESGTLTFFDNTVDAATGTLKLRATFPNTDRRIWPGQFLNCVVRLSEQENAVVVPSAAVQTGQKGQFVFVVKSDMTADMRPVTAGAQHNNETSIEKGVQTGETVVTDGQLRLVPGAKVEIVHRATGG